MGYIVVWISLKLHSSENYFYYFITEIRSDGQVSNYGHIRQLLKWRRWQTPSRGCHTWWGKGTEGGWWLDEATRNCERCREPEQRGRAADEQLIPCANRPADDQLIEGACRLANKQLIMAACRSADDQLIGPAGCSAAPAEEGCSSSLHRALGGGSSQC